MSEPITQAERERIRAQFPALDGPTVFLENAGGSQVPAVVADRIRDYMLTSYVQLGAGYPLSQQATRLVDEAHAFVRQLFGGSHSDGTVILGPSTSALIELLAHCYAEKLQPGAEIVIAETGHEANVGPWVRLERLGVEIRWWEVDPETATCPLDALDELLSERTVLVALPHVSNLLGEIVDLEEVTARCHAAGARVVADGVAYAPHRAMDVGRWDVDYYAYSCYKVYGPHMAALWAKADAIAELKGPNHFFIPDDELPYKFEIGGVCHEGCAGILGLGDYLRGLAGLPGDAPVDRAAIEQAFAVMTACELQPQQQLIDFLKGRDDVRIVGPAHAEPSRVGTVSFVHRKMASRDVVAEIDRSGIAVRHGHMYAYRLCERLGLDPDDGVVRVSLVHYNTPAEIERLTELLDRVLAA
jgi:cysteine desulfurase family protein (TIGR01976 family)